MGERDLAAPAAALRRPPWGWLALGLALAVVGGLGWRELAPPLPPFPDPPLAHPAWVRWLMTKLTAAIGERADQLLNLAALGVATAVAGRLLARRVGPPAPAILALAIFGSGVWAAGFTAGVALAPLALAVAAFGLVYAGQDRQRALEEVYRPDAGGALGLARWAGAGLLLAGLVSYSPLNAGLLVPAALALPKAGRRGAAAALAGGWLAGLGLEALLAGPAALVAAPSGVGWRWDGAAAAWNLLYLAAGRNVGLLTGYLPVVLLLALAGGRPRRRGLVTTCLVLAALSAVLLPFDFAGGWLHKAFLPLYGALWLAPARAPSRLGMAATAIGCGIVLWPLWAPPGPAALADGGAALTSSWPRRLLPYESTLLELPHHGAARRGRFALRAVSGCRYRPQEDRFEEFGGGRAEILLAAPPELEMVGIEFGPGASSELRVGGAELGHTLFRPDGRVGFELRLTRPRALHGLAHAERRHAVHLLSIEMPGRATDTPLKFRLLVAEAR